MQNEQNRNYSDYEPWNQETYRTGSTKPPKSHGGLIAVLLVLVILLCGVITLLGFMNIRLFQQISSDEDADTLPIVFSNEETTTASIDPSQSTQADPSQETTDTISIRPSPDSIANIPQEGGLSLQEIYETVIDSVVSISCSYSGGSSTGTGVILTEDGYIVTNCHVVEDAQRIQVQLTDGRNLDASLVGMDAISDLAVLLVSAEDLVPAPLGDSSVLRVGDSVVAIGDPLGVELRGTMTDGIISAINRDIDVEGRTMSLIQTNAALNSGNSGGPLINCYGQVIGINTMKMGDSMSHAGVEGLGFAIPSITVKDVVNQLISQGYVSGRPSLGISGEILSDFVRLYYQLPLGLYITEIDPDGSAAQVGIEPGDILVSVDNVRITDIETLQTQLYSYSPGDTVQAVVFRSGKQYSVTLTVGEATN